MVERGCIVCGTLVYKAGRRNKGRNGMGWTSNIGIIHRSEAKVGIEDAKFPPWGPDFIVEGDCKECNFRPGDEDDSYTVHVTCIIIPVMDIARPAKRQRRNINIANKQTPGGPSKTTVTSKLTAEKAAVVCTFLDEEFEILNDRELWEDDWEEIYR
ncbi:hypothetical protein GALMADRAFT_241480 [Galerina marginata CBS 339.88]|uniref:Uncharacterized protein n=1 Tax=Galerina marginata (strain CBS 339.88) TaxID=685588 RepID=A0A067TLZ6_GALM3|nr:hypothetical protein GALMADRAFT_241480 [Galerina marginata CBS 339.88]